MENRFTAADYEIDFLKCATWKDYKAYCEKYSGCDDNRFYQKAREQYDDLFYSAHTSASGCRKYLEVFPHGRHWAEAYHTVQVAEENSKQRGETLENVGILLIVVIFVGSMIALMVGADLTFIESLCVQSAFVPLYYTINRLTENKKKN